MPLGLLLILICLVVVSPAYAAENVRTWCGEQVSTDRPDLYPGKIIKVIYARPSEVEDAFLAVADRIQEDYELSKRLIAKSGKVFRYDMGTDCGPDYLDIQTVTLPNPSEYYQDPETRLKRVAEDLHKLLPASKNYLVYADNVSNGQGDDLWGNDGAEMVLDDRKSDQNLNNQPGRIAVMHGDRSAGGYFQNAWTGWWRFTHLSLHLLGAVQDSAPNHNDHKSGHCLDNQDFVCDHPSPLDVGFGSGVVCFKRTIDCGGNDYFNKRPRPGSYLATHFNLYDSKFLCARKECEPKIPSPFARLDADSTPQEVSTLVVREGARVVFRAGRSEGAKAYRWDLDGDGVYEKKAGAKVKWVAPKPGRYFFGVEVIGRKGYRSRFNSYISVAAPARVRFNINPIITPLQDLRGTIPLSGWVSLKSDLGWLALITKQQAKRLGLRYNRPYKLHNEVYYIQKERDLWPDDDGGHWVVIGDGGTGMVEGDFSGLIHLRPDLKLKGTAFLKFTLEVTAFDRAEGLENMDGSLGKTYRYKLKRSRDS